MTSLIHLFLEVFIATSHLSGSRPLASVGPSLGLLEYPVVAMCHGDNAALNLQDRTLPILYALGCKEVRLMSG